MNMFRYGDIHAGNVYEMWTCSALIVIGSCFFAWFVGVLTTELTDDLHHQTKSIRLEFASRFCDFFKLPPELKRAVLTHQDYHNREN